MVEGDKRSGRMLFCVLLALCGAFDDVERGWIKDGREG